VRGLLARGDVERADAELKQLIARYPESAAVHVQIGMLAGRKRNHTAARASFDRATQLQPDQLEALGGLVALDLAERNFAGARARIAAQLAVKPTAMLMTLSARTYAATGDLQSAEAALRQALDLDSGYLDAYNAIGQIYVAQGRLNEARAEFDQVAQRSPRPVAALTMVGMILQATGDVDGARARFERVMEIDSEAAVAANNLAWIYAETGGNLDVALHLAQTAQKRLPEAAAVSDTLGYIYYKKNLTSLAISTLKLGTEKDPENPTYHYHLGLAYADAEDTVRASEAFGRALALNPGFEAAAKARDQMQASRVRSAGGGQRD
jgi:tetratricopeptide (TPR) repeat protein